MNEDTQQEKLPEQKDDKTVEEIHKEVNIGGPAQAITDPGRRVRQAIVVIHGIGEQRPMDTLRGFVDAVLADNHKGESKYRSKPDAMNELFEMRCLQMPSDHQTCEPLTDFYEYYWAHHMQGSRYSQVTSWFLGLMMRSPQIIPQAIKPAYFLSWSLAFIAAGLWVWGLYSAGTGNSSFAQGVWQQKWLFASGVLIAFIQWLGSHFLLGYVADAARYLTPSPDNIEARNKIRSEGINLLRTLHSSGKYRRIVIVGHSLGSVIGYDIIRNLWVDLRKPVNVYPRKQSELKNFEQEAQTVDEGEVTPAKIEMFQQCQHRLWQEFIQVGIPWLITDFITLGSPLAHAQLLMADDPVDFKHKKEQYEYPCCPPDDGDKQYYSQQYQFNLDGENVIRNVFIPHHGAPFSCTRWTNMYFPYRRLILGDLIGGPLNGVFGKGIRDIAVVPSTGKFLDGTLASHVRYWTCGKGANTVPADVKPSLETLRKFLRMDFMRGKSSKVRPGGIFEQ